MAYRLTPFKMVKLYNFWKYPIRMPSDGRIFKSRLSRAALHVRLFSIAMNLCLNALLYIMGHNPWLPYGFGLQTNEQRRRKIAQKIYSNMIFDAHSVGGIYLPRGRLWFTTVSQKPILITIPLFRSTSFGIRMNALRMLSNTSCINCHLVFIKARTSWITYCCNRERNCYRGNDEKERKQIDEGNMNWTCVC